MRFPYSLIRLWRTKAPINKLKALFWKGDTKAENLVGVDIFKENCYYIKLEQQNPLIHDLGANVGLATIYFKSIYPTAKITCFEPSPSAMWKLRVNIRKLGLNDITLHEVALSNKEGNSFMESNKPNGNIVDSLTANKSQTTIKVETKLYSSFVTEPIDFIKVDVEGSEGDIFKDLERSKKLMFIDQGIVEFHNNLKSQTVSLGKFLSILDRAGYEYQIQSNMFKDFEKGKVQNILVYFYKRSLT